MVTYQAIYIKKPDAIQASIGDFHGPAGRNEQEAKKRLLDYMHSDTGMRHYQEIYPEVTEYRYNELLASLYEESGL